MDNVALIAKLIDAAYDSGYYSGQVKDGQPCHLAAMKERERLRSEILRRLAETQADASALLDALRDLVQCHAEGGFVEPDDDVLAAARAAIAKAQEA